MKKKKRLLHGEDGNLAFALDECERLREELEHRNEIIRLITRAASSLEAELRQLRKQISDDVPF